MLISHKDLARKLADLENKYDKQFRIVFEAITQLIEEDEKPKKKIGYIKEHQIKYGKKSHKKLKSKREALEPGRNEIRVCQLSQCPQRALYI